MAQNIQMGARRFGRVNWLGLYTLAAREIYRFLSVWTQTLLAPLLPLTDRPAPLELDAPQLIYQEGGYWVYKLPTEPSS